VVKRDLIKLGYSHAAIMNGLRSDLAYPKRKIRRAEECVTKITAKPCTCPDEHVEVWVRRI
jgi:hypothetical protein